MMTDNPKPPGDRPKGRRTRTLTSGRAVTVHRNDGLRKRCGCPRRSWSGCPHPWHFSFKWRETHHRFPIDTYAERPIVTKDEARDEADGLRRLIRAGTFPPPSATAPTTPADLTFATFTEKWRTGPRATMPDTLRANDDAICRRLGDLPIDGAAAR